MEKLEERRKVMLKVFGKRLEILDEGRFVNVVVIN